MSAYNKRLSCVHVSEVNDFRPKQKHSCGPKIIVKETPWQDVRIQSLWVWNVKYILKVFFIL